jgi:hypothetical protein
MRNIELRNGVLRFFGSFASPLESKRYSATAHTRRTFQASTGTTETTAAEPFRRGPKSADMVAEIGNEEQAL